MAMFTSSQLRAIADALADTTEGLCEQLSRRAKSTLYGEFEKGRS
jgi:hypothetical protein